MSRSVFKAILWLLAVGFSVAFAIICGPALIENPDISGAFAAGFVNPFSSGYALDAISCWWVLTAWVVYEAKAHGIRHGWIAVVLGIVPGVAAGFAAYLLLRLSQEKP